MTTADLYILPAGDGTPPTAADLEDAIPVSGYVSTNGITTRPADQTTTTRLDRITRVTAELLAIDAEQVARVLTELAAAMKEHEDAVRATHAALEELKAGPDHPRGRDAQTSPYDIGRRAR